MDPQQCHTGFLKAGESIMKGGFPFKMDFCFLTVILWTQTAALYQIFFSTKRQPKNQCCGSGSGIRCLFDPWIRDGEKVSIWIRDEQPGSYFIELRNHFFGLKYLNSLMRIRDGDSSDQFGCNTAKNVKTISSHTQVLIRFLKPSKEIPYSQLDNGHHPINDLI